MVYMRRGVYLKSQQARHRKKVTVSAIHNDNIHKVLSILDTELVPKRVLQETNLNIGDIKAW